MGGATVVARMVLHRDKDYLLSDDVSCDVNDNGNILIPFDNAVVKTLKGIVKIEVSITRGTDELTLQFPLWVSVNGSILDDAEVTPESEGTIPDLLKEAAEALEDATEALGRLGSYSNLEDKPQINGVTLDGDQTSDELGLQKKLTAGANILIDANGNISVTGVTKYKEELNYTQLDNCTENGVLYYTTIGGYDAFVVARNGFDHIRQFAIVGDKRLITRRKQKETAYQPAGEWSAWEGINYNDLSNKPQINNVTLDGNKVASEFGLQNAIITVDYQNPPSASATRYDKPYLWINDVDHTVFILRDVDYTQAPRDYFYHWDRLSNRCIVSTDAPPAYLANDVNPMYDVGDIWAQTNADGTQLVSTFICTKKTRHGFDYITWRYEFDWLKIGGSQIVSGVVNQNGTITFTDSDGNTFTTTGSSVIGPQGDDYVLTAQDKTDIADIVLQELPTTQGVLYGNEND